MRFDARCRLAATVVWVIATSTTIHAPPAFAVSPPSVDPSSLPADTRPGPDQPMRQASSCAQAVAAPRPNVALPAPGFAMLDITAAWEYSTGNGVTVAVIDTGVSPSPRLPVIAGGDYVSTGDGLSDCDVHGTVVASLIAAAPQGSQMPRPMPPTPAFPARSQASGVLKDVAAVSAAPDGVVGVAPHATLLSIRQSSRAFEPASYASGDTESRRKAGTLSTLARAIVHAVNLGAKVINVSVAACVPAADPLDQRSIGAALWYAATVRDAVVVTAAGNEGEDGCAPNPDSDPLDSADPRGWKTVKTVSSPSWFTDFVLPVGAVDPTGAPMSKSLGGPWVAVAAPGVGVVGLSPASGVPVNAYSPVRPGESEVPFWGTSFAAAYVSGVAALVRAKYPELSASQVIRRIERTAHNPPRGIDNKIGYGVVDPVAALTFDVQPGPRVPVGPQRRVVTPPAKSPVPDRRAHAVALVFTGSLAGGLMLLTIVRRARRAL